MPILELVEGTLVDCSSVTGGIGVRSHHLVFVAHIQLVLLVTGLRNIVNSRVLVYDVDLILRSLDNLLVRAIIVPVERSIQTLRVSSSLHVAVRVLNLEVLYCVRRVVLILEVRGLVGHAAGSLLPDRVLCADVLQIEVLLDSNTLQGFIGRHVLVVKYGLKPVS